MSPLAAFAVTVDGYGTPSIEVLTVDETGAQVDGESLTLPLDGDADLDAVLADAGLRRVSEWTLAPFGATATVERVN